MATVKEVVIPDLGNVSDAAVIEIAVKPGDQVKQEDTLITLESEKASMDVPSPFAGTIKELKVKVNDKVTKGDIILTLETEAAAATTETAKTEAKTENKTETQPVAQTPAKQQSTPSTAPEAKSAPASNEAVYAGPGVRRLARELGVDLSQVQPSGPKSRVLKQDVQQFIKTQMQRGSVASGAGLPSAPQIDFSQFGAIENIPLSKIKRLTATNLHRNWLLVPHVTQFAEADITELEAFRKAQQSAAEKNAIKLTPLAFIMKAVVTTLKAFPNFNASLDPGGEQLILKKYFHIGVAVDTPNGLVVPVIRDADKKALMDLARELAEVSQRARNNQLKIQDMQGSSFTISSLGGIGGTAFTPIVNLPDVAILGVSKAAMKPVYQNGEFVPRLMLPLSLSYDHRVIDGAEGARFIVSLIGCLTDIRKLL